MKTYKEFIQKSSKNKTFTYESSEGIEENLLQKGLDTIRNKVQGTNNFTQGVGKLGNNKPALNTQKKSPAFTKKHNSAPIKELHPRFPAYSPGKVNGKQLPDDVI